MARDRRLARSPRCRLQVEPLEARALLSLGLLGQWNAATPLYSDGWLVGNRALLGHFGNSGGIDLIDISDPSNPVRTATFRSPDTNNDYRDVEAQWQNVGGQQRLIGYFSGDGGNGQGVVIADVTDASNPVQLFNIRPAQGGTNLVHTLSVDGPFLYEADTRSRTIRVFDVSNPAQPIKLRDINSNLNEAIHEVTAQNGRLYTAGISGGTAEVFDISGMGTPGNPVSYLGRVSSTISRAHTTWPTDDGRFMAVARETDGGDLSFWNIDNPAQPQLAWRMDLREPGGCCVHQVMIRGNLLYSSWYTAGLYVHDITDPYNPVELGHYDTYPGGSGGFNGAWGIFGGRGRDSKVIGGFDMQSGLFLLQLVDDPEDAPFGGSPFQGSGSRAVRGAWAEKQDVSAFVPEQIARLDDDILTLTLGAGDDTVVVAPSLDGKSVGVVINDTLRFNYATTDLRRLNIRALEGDDRVILDPRLRLQFLLDGGPGQDTVEGWSDAWVTPPIVFRPGVHAMRIEPYSMLAVEDVRTVPAVGGPLDYSAHGLIDHGSGTAAPAGADVVSRLGHGGMVAGLGLVAGHRAALTSHGGARLSGAEHGYGGLPKQVVWHKPG